MEELLKRVAELKGMPASLIQRSAQARADETGATLETVLKEWAGEDDATDQTTEESVVEPSVTEDAPEPAAATDSEPREVTTDYLVQLAADAKRMPPKLILSSATARAEHAGTTLDEVLALWAGVDLDELRANGPTEPAKQDAPEAEPEPKPTPTSAPAPGEAPPEPAAVAAGTITMDELLEKVAGIRGMPGVLIKRSAAARAKETGEPVEAVLADWAGVDVSTVVTAAAVSKAEHTAAEPQPASTSKEEAEPPGDEPAKVEVIEASQTESESPAEGEPEPSATRSRYPRWLAAAFVVIPLFGIGSILAAPNGPDCGTAGQLLVDPQSGEAVSCDGSDYPSLAVDFFSDGERLYAQCAACHAADGSGGAGPAFLGGAVLATFPADSCGDHKEWVSLGTAGWPDATYGATAKPVGGAGLMPGFGTQLSEEDIASVVLYERVQFGGQDLADAEIDCGLIEASAG